jgi:hypothetical protein
MPGFHAVLAMHAFSLVEASRYEEARDRGLHALSLMPGDARAHHALVHVCEMKGDPLGGGRLMHERHVYWADSVAATHCWWHWALFHLAEGAVTDALGIYDQRLRQERSVELADLIDSSALLWRLELRGAGPGSRWRAPGYRTLTTITALLATCTRWSRWWVQRIGRLRHVSRAGCSAARCRLRGTGRRRASSGCPYAARSWLSEEDTILEQPSY